MIHLVLVLLLLFVLIIELLTYYCAILTPQPSLLFKKKMILSPDKATKYPLDSDIVVSLFRQQGWQKYKAEVMEEVPKDRWPAHSKHYEPFHVV